MCGQLNVLHEFSTCPRNAGPTRSCFRRRRGSDFGRAWCKPHDQRSRYLRCATGAAHLQQTCYSASMLEKDEVARLLAEAHRDMEPTINRIIRLIADQENHAREPVKLLEVNPA